LGEIRIDCELSGLVPGGFQAEIDHGEKVSLNDLGQYGIVVWIALKFLLNRSDWLHNANTHRFYFIHSSKSNGRIAFIPIPNPCILLLDH
jgi:hypothetical protein